MKALLFAALALTLLLLGSAAEAADDAGPDRVVYKKKTVIDLSGAVIEGDLARPENSFVTVRKASRFSNLITVRDNFVPELLASPDSL
jgi:hypothetical protein